MLTLDQAKYYSDHPEGFDFLYARALQKACHLPAGAPFLEIGTRCGGSALLLLQAIRESGMTRPLITVDPYGKAYHTKGSTWEPIGEIYYREMQWLLGTFCREHKLDHFHFRLTSFDFFRVWDQGGIWLDGREINSQPLALAYVDGEHTEETVASELGWLRPRMARGGLIVIDDTENVKDSKDGILIDAFKQGTEHGNRLYWEPDHCRNC